MASILSAALRAQRQTKSLFIAWSFSSFLALPVGILLTVLFGVHGAALGMLLYQLVFGLVVFDCLSRYSTTCCAEKGLQTELASIGSRLATAAGMTRVKARHKFLAKFFTLSDELGMPYCVLHGYDDFPLHIRSDVDCMMHSQYLPNALATALHANRARLEARIVQWYEGGCHGIVLEASHSDGSVCFLPLDISTNYDFNRRCRFYSGEQLLQHRRRRGSFWILEPHLEFGTSLVRRIFKSQLEPQHRKKLEQLYSEAPVLAGQEIRRFWGARSGELLEQAAATGNWSPVLSRLLSLRLELVGRNVLRHPLQTTIDWLSAIWRVLRRCIRPTNGFHVLFLGPDGAGKTSVMNDVSHRLAPSLFKGTSIRSFPPRLLKRRSGVPGKPHALPLRSRVHSLARAVLYWFTYYSPGYFVTVRPELAQSKLVLHDRHLIDVAVDAKRYRYNASMTLIRLIWRFVPKPNLIILLDAPPKNIHDRKQELPLPELERQCREYRALAKSLPNAYIIDASKPLREVSVDVNRLILDRLHRRTVSRMDLELAST